jgi:hypothetical protein
MKRFIIFLAISLVASEPTLKHLIHVAYIGSHCPNNSYPDIKWECNPMELTPVGMRQLYLLGRGIRHKYFDKFPEMQYNSLEVSFRSIFSEEKTITTSAYALATGLYHGTGFNLNNDQVVRAVPPIDPSNYKPYQDELGTEALPHYYAVLPVMTLTEEPNYNFEALTLCPRIDKLVNEKLDNDEDLKSRIDKNESIFSEKLYPRLKEILKLNESVANMEEALKHTDYIIAAKYYLKELSSKPTEEDYKLMDELYYTVRFDKLLADDHVAQLIAYGFLTELKVILEGIKNGTNTRYKFTSYTLNDVHILALLKLLKFEYPKKMMPFSSSLIIAVENDTNMKVRIAFNNENITFKNNKDVMQDCIPLDNFTEWISNNTLENFKRWCDESTEEVASKWFTYTFIIAGIFLIILGTTWILIIKCRRSKDEDTSKDELNIE